MRRELPPLGSNRVIYSVDPESLAEKKSFFREEAYTLAPRMPAMCCKKLNLSFVANESLEFD